jgi:hypothetical protein
VQLRTAPFPGRRSRRRVNGARRLAAMQLRKRAVRDGAAAEAEAEARWRRILIRKLKSGGYRLYSRKKNAKTGKRRNLGTFSTRRAAAEHEKAVQYFKGH